MTQEEKAKAYDEALERAKCEIDTKGIGDTVELCKSLFSELRESEDERIRKVIYQLMLGMREEIFTSQDEIVTKEKVLAYLEKQKDAFENGRQLGIMQEQARQELGWPDEKQKEQKHPDGCFTCDEYKKGYEEGRRNGFTAGYNKAIKEVEQKEQKPVEWSEEDEKHIDICIKALKEWEMQDSEDFSTTISFLKSLRPSWKPSEWQMSMLLAVINDPNNAGSESCYLTLKSIYEQLKKL